MQTVVHRLSMQHPGDLGALAALFDAGVLAPADVVAVIGKTEGNGGVNDFTRGYFTFAPATLLSERLRTSRSRILETLPRSFTGAPQGVLRPSNLCFIRARETLPTLGPDP